LHLRILQKLQIQISFHLIFGHLIISKIQKGHCDGCRKTSEKILFLAGETRESVGKKQTGF